MFKKKISKYKTYIISYFLYRVKKIVGMKKAMTKTMTESNSIPAFTF